MERPKGEKDRQAEAASLVAQAIQNAKGNQNEAVQKNLNQVLESLVKDIETDQSESTGSK